jgi:hypothetical protein
MNHALARLANYSSATMDAITEVNTHTYAGNNRAELAAATAAAGKRMVMSEWGSSDISGKDISREITRDMTDMKPGAWAIWQPDWLPETPKETLSSWSPGSRCGRWCGKEQSLA